MHIAVVSSGRSNIGERCVVDYDMSTEKRRTLCSLSAGDGQIVFLPGLNSLAVDDSSKVMIIDLNGNAVHSERPVDPAIYCIGAKRYAVLFGTRGGDVYSFGR